MFWSVFRSWLIYHGLFCIPAMNYRSEKRSDIKEETQNDESAIFTGYLPPLYVFCWWTNMNCIILDSSFFFVLLLLLYFLQYSRSFSSVPLFIYIRCVRHYFFFQCWLLFCIYYFAWGSNLGRHVQLLYFTSKKSNSLHTRLVLFFFQGCILM